MHDAVILNLIATATEKLGEARGEARQVPDDLGGVPRDEIEAALRLTDASLKADPSELRGDVAAAHAFIRRCRFPRDEHRGLFGALAELRFTLEEIEDTAAALDYPEPETSIPLPRQHLVPRRLLASALDALESRLEDFDQKLANLERQRSGDAAYEDQDDLIAHVTEKAGIQSVGAHEIAAQRQVDIRGLSDFIEGLGRIVATFVGTVAPAVARVTQAVRSSARLLGYSGRDVVAAGGDVVLTAVARTGGLVPGARFRDFPAAPEMIVVPAGKFLMGSPDGKGHRYEWPPHEVAIAYAFAVGIVPVTRGEFAAFMAAEAHEIEDGAYVWNGEKWVDDPNASWRNPGFAQTDDHPVVCVNWHDAQAYVAWLRERSGKPYRLLSEAEWEYCCRAGTATPYNTGDAITPAQANFGRHEKGTTPVKRFPTNPWGLHDMHGNVWEWCEDAWHPNYEGNPPTGGSTWKGGDEDFRVLRGGCWGSNPHYLRSAGRDRCAPDPRNYTVGFRVARTL